MFCIEVPSTKIPFIEVIDLSLQLYGVVYNHLLSGVNASHALLCLHEETSKSVTPKIADQQEHILLSSLVNPLHKMWGTV